MTGADMRTACQKPGDFTAGFIHRAIRPPFVIFFTARQRVSSTLTNAPP
jgi:hypothetical protein